jgi:tetratricopeptide (TPR) repeat protein
MFGRNVSLAAALLFLGLVAYVPAMGGGFIWDDDAYLTKNQVVKSEHGLWQIWSDPMSGPQYYPLVFTTFWAEYQLWGLKPLGYHVTNVLLHAVNAILLWQVLRRLAVPGAWLAAAVFVVHPVYVESVAWVTERKNVLSGLFYLAAALAYFRFSPPEPDQSPQAARWGSYAAAVLLFLAALLSKTVTCSLPAALLLVLWWKRGRVGRRDLLALAPMFVLGVAFALLTIWVERQHGAVGGTWARSPVERVLVAGRALWFYVGKLAWPADLTFMYPRWTIDPRVWWQYVFPLAALVTAAVLWALRNRTGRGPLVAYLFFAGTLLPALGFFNMYMMRYSFVADHLQYLPSIGLIALAAAGAVTLSRYWKIEGTAVGIGAAAAVVLTLGTLTWLQGRVYKDEEVLWTDTIAKNPDCWMAYNNLGSVYGRQGRFDKAMSCYLDSLGLEPDHAEAHNNVGLILAERGDLENAVFHFNEALRNDPRLVQTHFNLGVVLARLGRLAEAEPHFVEALSLDPDMPQAHLQLGLVLEKRGDLEGALPHLTRAAESFPQDADVQYTMALVLLRLGRPQDALRHSQQAVRLQPSVARNRVLLAHLLQQLGRKEAAREVYQEAVRLEPGWPARAGQTAWQLATDPDPARRNGRLALYLARASCEATDNQDARLLDALAAALAEVGRYEDAAAAARSALRLASAADQSGLAAKVQERLRLYEQGKPFREDAKPDR